MRVHLRFFIGVFLPIWIALGQGSRVGQISGTVEDPVSAPVTGASIAYQAYSLEAIQLFCHKHARYGLPTVELVEWLRAAIGDWSAIEIGAGAGDLAHHLQIPATDNRMQEIKSVAAYYELLKQPVIPYGKNIQHLNALTAIETLAPEVVVAQWVTHKYDAREPHRGGNMHGVDEQALLATGVTYILVGNEAVHQHSRILEQPHEEYAFPWLWSRAQQPELNRIWVWRRRSAPEHSIDAQSPSHPSSGTLGFV